MMETALAIGKAAISFLPSSVRWINNRYRRPAIALKRAPRNLFDHIKIGSSREHVRETLGPPRRADQECWQYRFADLLVEVVFFGEHGGVTAVMVGLVGTAKKQRFEVPGCSKALGVMTVADVLDDDPEATVTYRSSLRQEELFVHTVYGPSCIRQCWTFGVLSCPYSRALHHTTFRWDWRANRLETPPAEIRVNWVGTADSLEPIDGFDWSIE